MKKVNILGTDYKILLKEEKDDPKLKDADGYCDSTTKTIVIAKFDVAENSVGDMDVVYEHILTHEIIHAFMYESGLKNECSWDNEEMVDWVAYQYSKIDKAVKSVKKK